MNVLVCNTSRKSLRVKKQTFMIRVWLLEPVHGDACKSTGKCVWASVMLAVCSTICSNVMLCFLNKNMNSLISKMNELKPQQLCIGDAGDEAEQDKLLEILHWNIMRLLHSMTYNWRDWCCAALHQQWWDTSSEDLSMPDTIYLA